MEEFNPYAHLSHEEKIELKDNLQTMYEHAMEHYRSLYEEWAVVMNALKNERPS